ncbi:MAG: peptide ABC transporter substrate-binding protein [Candidatus Pacebacteria bacterium]|nr:peptide ABC transporter substrate-binding protein [Candidatus Paceibacterota bacterium]
MDIPFLSSSKKIIYRISFLHNSLNPEKVLIFWILFFLSFVSFFTALITINNKYLISVPDYGGTISEGIIGTPRFINPVLATTDQDKDITALVFSGLTKKTFDGGFMLDIAESLEESDDGLRYRITIKQDASFHDGQNITSDDIIFTIDKVQNPLIKSPHRVEWEGVSAEKINDKEIIFTLKKPFPLFKETLSLGILPKHIWKNLSDEQISLSDFNIKAIGSGPYLIDTIETSSGIPNKFILRSYKNYTLGRPFIEIIKISTYQNEKYLLKALLDNDIQRLHGVTPEKVASLGVASSSIHTSLLPRTFSIFFNPNKSSPLADKNVRKALQMAINKDRIVTQVLSGYGMSINTPYPFDQEQVKNEYNPEKARTLLFENKTIQTSASSTFKVSLITANTDEMREVAEIIKNDWEKIGVTVTIKIYDVSDLNQNVIKDRDFEVLLFGAITQTPSDLYAFWHSSQRNYPGLNISNYVSKDLDEHLEILRSSINEEERNFAYNELRKEFAEEVPGIFLFAPSLIYITNDKITTFLPNFSYDNASRFTLVENWYRYTDKVWPATYYKPLLEKIQNIIH